jgi:hypothetical protein
VVVLAVCGFISRLEKGLDPNRTESQCSVCVEVGGWLRSNLMIVFQMKQSVSFVNKDIVRKIYIIDDVSSYVINVATVIAKD